MGWGIQVGLKYDLGREAVDPLFLVLALDGGLIKDSARLKAGQSLVDFDDLDWAGFVLECLCESSDGLNHEAFRAVHVQRQTDGNDFNIIFLDDLVDFAEVILQALSDQDFEGLRRDAQRIGDGQPDPFFSEIHAQDPAGHTGPVPFSGEIRPLDV